MSGKRVVTPLAPLPPSVWLRRPRTGLPFPLGAAGTSLHSRGRHALWHGLRQLQLHPGDEVLAPAWHHGSEVEVLVRSGLAPRFYDATPTLEPDEAELESLLTPRTRALHLTHFLGFPQDAARWRSWCDGRALLLLEDAAQAWLARHRGVPVGAHGDLAVWCLYKTFGLPDGAALHVRGEAAAPTGRRSTKLYALALEHALWLVTRSAILSRAAEWVRTERTYDVLADMGLGEPQTPLSRTTLLVLPRVADERVAERRRANYRRLQESLGELVPRAFRELPDEASPFLFPIAVADKERLLRHLRAHYIRAVDLWSEAHAVIVRDAYPRAAAMRRHLIGLPVHQEVRPADAERIAAAVSAAAPAFYPC